MGISRKKVQSQLGNLLTLFISASLLYLFINTTSNDMEEYFLIIDMVKEADLLESFLLLRFEIGSLTLLWSFSQLFSQITTVYLIGLLALFVKYAVFCKYLNYPNLAFFTYVFTFSHIVDANQIRLALALCVVFYALCTHPKSKFSYLGYAFIATLFHYSGVIILCLYFVSRPILLLIGIVILGFIFDTLINASSYLSFATIWKSSSDGAVNFTSSLFLIQVLISLACMFEWRYLSDGQKRGALLNFIGVVIYLVFFENATVAHRVREMSQVGIIAIIFLGERRLTDVKLAVSLGGAYILAYNLFAVSSELMSIFDIEI